MRVQLQPAGPDDEAEILTFATAFHIEDGHPLRPGGQAAIRSLLTLSPLGQIYLLKVAGETVGYCALTYTMSLEFGGTVMILDDLYVLPAHRGHGVGSAVLREVEAQARREGFVQLFLEVENENQRALRLYERHGFRIRHRQMMEKML